MTTLEIELSELEERLAKLKAKARAAAVVATATKENGSVLSAKWEGRDTFTVPEAAKILGVSRGAAYEAVKQKELPVIWIGRRCIVPRLALEKLLAGAA